MKQPDYLAELAEILAWNAREYARRHGRLASAVAYAVFESGRDCEPDGSVVDVLDELEGNND